MSKIIYNKLVRDKIPEVIQKSGKTCETKVIDGEALKEALVAKLKEEVAEFEEAHSMEEMADILEVLEGICKFHHWDMEEVLKVKSEKRDKRGGFEQGIMLLETNDK